MRVDWHRLFDRNQWAILPATELLVDILAASVRNKAHVRLNKGVDLFSKVGNAINSQPFEAHMCLVFKGPKCPKACATPIRVPVYLARRE